MCNTEILPQFSTIIHMKKKQKSETQPAAAEQNSGKFKKDSGKSHNHSANMMSEHINSK